MSKALHATVDFYDDLIHAGRMFGADDFERMMAFLKSIGVRRVDWIVDTVWRLYDFPVGPHASVLHAAVAAAHGAGLELHALFKPFERAFAGPRTLCPHTFPAPPDGGWIDDMRGRITTADTFLLQNPHLRMKRRPGDWDPPGPVRAVKLVKADPGPTRVRAEHLTLWASDRNGCLERLPGGFRLSEGVEWRDDIAPPRGKRRVLTLEGLDIPDRFRYVFVKCSLTDGTPDFANAPLELMELYGEGGKRIPATPAERKVRPEDVQLRFPETAISAYGRLPEVREFFADRERVKAHCGEFYIYDRSSCDPYRGELLFLDRRGFAGAARGKNPYLLGTLSPVYPEVREHWLGLIRSFLDAGVDGVNVRSANHGTKSHERLEYGFNEPVLEACGGRVDRAAAARVNGDAYTDFLRSAKALVAGRGLPFSVHVNISLLHRDDRPWRTSDNTPPVPNLEFQWERWIREGIADAVVLKGLGGNAQARVDHFIDAVAGTAQEAGTPVVLSSSRHFGFGKDKGQLAREMERTLADDRLHAFDLYEAAAFMRLEPDGTIKADPEVAALARGFARKAESC